MKKGVSEGVNEILEWIHASVGLGFFYKFLPRGWHPPMSRTSMFGKPLSLFVVYFLYLKSRGRNNGIFSPRAMQVK